MHEISRRAFLGGSAAILLLSGCSTPPAELRPDGHFPAEVKHALGTTSITAKPKRVVTVGLASADICVALGVAPVLIPTSSSRENKTTAWFDRALAKLEVALPETYHADQLSVRQIARFNPDLILAVNSSIDRELYSRLTEIAPVVAYPDEPGNTDWRTATQMSAAALGADGANEVIAATEKAIAEASKPFANFSALTGLFFEARGISGAAFEIFGADSNPQRILGDYGISVAPGVLDLETDGRLSPTGSYDLPHDDARNIRADVYVASVRKNERDYLVDNQVFEVFPGFRKGRGTVLDYATDAYALHEASPLSVSSAAKNIISEFARVNYVMNDVK